MIRFEGVVKRYPGAASAAVASLDLTVEEGTTCALIGPSGCGKSTTLRMVNRLVEPDAGRVLVGGRDVAGIDPVTLRRGIGYVLQGVGLFPHRSVGRNVAAVPALLGWKRARILERVDAMLDLVGLDPALYRDRRPSELSGGQRQRVGVARALAADPPILLMDEPFGAVDPVARDRLQDEIGAILRNLRKTVILVTHDIGEAMRMGDRVALMRDGHLVQADTPEQLLAAPADDFVENFLGGTRALRRLERLRVRDIADAQTTAPSHPAIAPEASVREALDRMLATGATRLVVGSGSVTLDAVRKAAQLPKDCPESRG
ncbi:ABC transporter ATP-binding protein [Methylorubrum suomiense]|uniref:Osmoprotectant import ATP-binding protein OsmV n=1 Tax=Methylorubrum suomiense TaxID=144191 RepID=A0ABQ4V1P4_9HYPH|nr:MULTISPECIES: ATP-binding cassette domain-containing protein [Methylobacteriaceae]GJE78321.1 Osmoprotectant import ATP-binding protein OsmV [Methylorubrum suomiense]